METQEYVPKLPRFVDLIVFEDERLIVINKPPFVSSLDDRGGGDANILRLAKAYHPDAQVCHRLDRETSGILLIAKDPETYRSVSIEFERRRVRKVYHALINGVHRFDHLKVDLPILNLGNKNVSIDKSRGKNAVTWFHSIQFFRHYTLVECQPVTGRMHQIRIHLASQRASIVGDALYKGQPIHLSEIKRGYTLSKGKEEQPLMRRFALHAHALEIQIDGRPYRFEAPYPKDFSTLLRQLARYDAE